MDAEFKEMLSRLERLSEDVAELRDGFRRAVHIAELAPDMALTQAPRCLNTLYVRCTNAGLESRPGPDPLSNCCRGW